MLRKTFAVAMLCLTLLFCGLDTSAVGAPAEPETALHALGHRHDGGARSNLDEALAAAVVVLVSFWLLTSARAGRPILVSRAPRHDVRLSVGWLTARAERGPPARA